MTDYTYIFGFIFPFFFSLLACARSYVLVLVEGKKKYKVHTAIFLVLTVLTLSSLIYVDFIAKIEKVATPLLLVEGGVRPKRSLGVEATPVEARTPLKQGSPHL